MKYAEICFRQKTFGLDTFTFSVPLEFQGRIQVGQIVEAPLRKSRKKALVVALSNQEPKFKTRPLEKLLTPALISEKQIQIAQQIAQDCFSSLTKVLMAFLPEKIWNSDGLPPVRVRVRLRKISKKLRGAKQQEVVNFLQQIHEADLRTVQKKCETNSTVLRNMIDKGYLQKNFQERFSAQKLEQIKIEKIHNDKKEIYQKLLNSSAALLWAPTGSGKSFLIRRLAGEIAQQGKQVLICSPEIALNFETLRKARELFGEQNIAVFHSQMNESKKKETWWRIKQNEAKIILGSRSALFLPWTNLGLIALEEEHETAYKNDQSPRYHTRDIAELLAKKYQAQVIFSSATPSLETYYRAQQNELDLIKLFPSPTPTPATPPLPTPPTTSLSTLVEHKICSKDGNVLSFNASTSAPCSASSPLEHKICSTNNNTINIVDLKDETLAKNKSPISRLLAQKIRECTARHEKVLLFLNRRGFHNTIFCQDCGQSQKCSHCQVALTSHQKNNQNFLLCHHCGRIFYAPERCDYCGGSKISAIGWGTQQVEEVMRQMFPDLKILRADRDSTSRKGSTEQILQEFLEDKGDVLIGTQIITKGFDCEQIGLVGVILADNSLQIPDFRAEERTWQTIQQVIGRTGRGQNKGQVVIQTLLPEADIWQKIITNDSDEFYENLLSERQKLTLPPYCQIAKIIFTDYSKEKAFQKARQTETKIKKILQKNEKVLVVPALIPFKHHKYHVHVLLYANNVKEILNKANLREGQIDLNPVDAF